MKAKQTADEHIVYSVYLVLVAMLLGKLITVSLNHRELLLLKNRVLSIHFERLLRKIIVFCFFVDICILHCPLFIENSEYKAKYVIFESKKKSCLPLIWRSRRECWVGPENVKYQKSSKTRKLAC